MNTIHYSVSGMTCDHCVNAITKEVGTIPNVASVNVDLGAKSVKVTGNELDDSAIREAIVEAGYEVDDATSSAVNSCCGGSECATN